eukprot:GEMP01056850.1.p1 GENE.GEMP01056850.1~~GEMP01056850.1.p1  ORF type:complete len:360 (-),score=87.84 GEMP01056850.1:277-1356(-)
MVERKDWDKIAREEVKKAEDEEKEEKELCDKAMGLEDGPTGPPTMVAAEERKEQANQQQARNEMIQKLKENEKTVESPESGDISCDKCAVHIIKAKDVTLNVVDNPLKVFVHECSKTTIKIMEIILSSTLEVYECKGISFEIGVPLATIQLDSADDCVLNIAHEEIVLIVHDKCTNIRVHAAGKTHTIPDTTVQSVSKWKDNAFETVPVARDEGNFPTNITDSKNSNPGQSVEPTKELSAQRFKEDGNSAFQACDFMQAISFYSQSLERNETSVVYCNRSQAWLKIGQIERALEDAEKSIALDSTNTKAYFRKGIALHASERYQEAIEALVKAEELDPKNKQITDAIRMAQLKARKQQS